jgi:hypothetical protein
MMDRRGSSSTGMVSDRYDRSASMENERHVTRMAATRQGLCASCAHARIVESSKGSSFVLCGLSYTDPTFDRYPRLPVIACNGYVSTGGKE